MRWPGICGTGDVMFDIFLKHIPHLRYAVIGVQILAFGLAIFAMIDGGAPWWMVGLMAIVLLAMFAFVLKAMRFLTRLLSNERREND